MATHGDTWRHNFMATHTKIRGNVAMCRHVSPFFIWFPRAVYYKTRLFKYLYYIIESTRLLLRHSNSQTSP